MLFSKTGMQKPKHKRPVQLALPLRRGRRGGARRGAGRKRRPGSLLPPGRPGVSHLARAELKPAHPVHVTLRLRSGLASLRRKAVASVVFAAFRAVKGEARSPGRSRVVHFTLQSNHLHLLVEARGKVALARAIQGLAVRLARAVNRKWGRRGTVFADRYHARSLRTPLEVRRALVYVLNNHRRHFTPPGAIRPFDEFSTAAYFDGFTRRIPRWPKQGFVPPREPPVAPARTWLMRKGWRRHGLVAPTESPSPR